MRVTIWWQRLVNTVLREAWLEVAARPTRSALTAVGIALGCGVVVASIGLASTSETRIGDTFEMIQGTVLTASASASNTAPNDGQPESVLTWSSTTLAEGLRGVVAAGCAASVPGTHTISRFNLAGTFETAAPSTTAPVVVVDGNLPTAEGGKMLGQFFSAFESSAQNDDIVLGQGVAAQIGLAGPMLPTVAWVDGVPLRVVGILRGVLDDPTLLGDILVPPLRGRDQFAVSRPDRLIVRTGIGDTAPVAQTLPLVLSPRSRGTVQLSVPASATLTKHQVTSQVAALLDALGALCSLVGGIGVANVMLVSIMERIPNIGLRRALGGSVAAIGGQVLAEALLLGLVGGAVGTGLGAWAVAADALLIGASPKLSWLVIAAAPLGGSVVGLLAGVYPARRAMSVQPVVALRQGS